MHTFKFTLKTFILDSVHLSLTFLLFLTSNKDIREPNAQSIASRTNTPVGGAVVAVVGQEVVVELPEDVQRDPAVRRRHVVVGLAEHGVKAVQSQVLAEQLVCHAVDVQQTLQFLQARDTQSDLEKRKCIPLRTLSDTFTDEAERTMMEVRSSLSKRLMASSRDL